MYHRRSAMLAAIGVITIGVADIRAAEADKAIHGYNCMSVDYKALNATEEEIWNGTASPPVFAGPTEGSKKLGVSAGIVYVAWPLEKLNGFVRVLRPNGDKAWISEIALKPYRNASASAITCTLDRDERGLIRYLPSDAPPAGR
jgi:hypothetical protein